MISKEIFVDVIENLHQQYLRDKDYVNGVSGVFGIDIPFYDNSHLLSSTLAMLRLFFPVDSDGHCDIEHFCYVCDFGKVGDIESASALYDFLVNGKNG
jgi:hypothetical protein